MRPLWTAQTTSGCDSARAWNGQPGLYPFVTHSFASVDMGAVGLLKVGEVEGTMSHWG